MNLLIYCNLMFDPLIGSQHPLLPVRIASFASVLTTEQSPIKKANLQGILNKFP